MKIRKSQKKTAETFEKHFFRSLFRLFLGRKTFIQNIDYQTKKKEDD